MLRVGCEIRSWGLLRVGCGIRGWGLLRRRRVVLGVSILSSRVGSHWLRRIHSLRGCLIRVLGFLVHGLLHGIGCILSIGCSDDYSCRCNVIDYGSPAWVASQATSSTCETRKQDDTHNYDDDDRNSHSNADPGDAG